jgi:predicted GIY-YIG superfamily endonuclease
MKWFVYILECSNKALYTGVTSNLTRRFEDHKKGYGGHYTSYNPPVKILFIQTFKTRSEALKREAQIKGWTRDKKFALINGDLVSLKQL